MKQFTFQGKIFYIPSQDSDSFFLINHSDIRNHRERLANVDMMDGW